MIAIDFIINNVKVFPEMAGNPDVVSFVEWQANFSKEGIVSTAFGESFLNEPEPNSFIDYSNLTEQMISDWVIGKEGGQDFIATLTEFHEGLIDSEIKKQSLKNKVLPFTPRTEADKVYSVGVM